MQDTTGVSQDRPEQGVECGRPGGPAVVLAGRCMDGARLELLGGRTNTPPKRLPTRFRALAPRRKKSSQRPLTAATLCFRYRCCIPPEDELNEMAGSKVAGSPAGSPLPDSRLAGWRQLVATLLSVVARSARLGVWVRNSPPAISSPKIVVMNVSGHASRQCSISQPAQPAVS